MADAHLETLSTVATALRKDFASLQMELRLEQEKVVLQRQESIALQNKNMQLEQEKLALQQQVKRLLTELGQAGRMQGSPPGVQTPKVGREAQVLDILHNIRWRGQPLTPRGGNEVYAHVMSQSEPKIDKWVHAVHDKKWDHIDNLVAYLKAIVNKC